jgi:hypothetical protein
MLNGFHGMQGYFEPDVTDDFCHLSHLSAKHLIDHQLFTPACKATLLRRIQRLLSSTIRGHVLHGPSRIAKQCRNRWKIHAVSEST